MRREPIASRESEMGMIGSALKNPTVAVEFADVFEPQVYHWPAHKIVAKAILDATKAGVVIDYITFTQFLRDRHELEKIGGLGYLTELFNFVPGAANAEHYSHILREKRRLRRAEEIYEDGLKRVRQNQADPESVFTAAQKGLMEIASMAGGKSRTVTMRENVMRAHDRVESIMLGTITPGLPTGIAALDRILGGLRDSEVIAITGDTGGGKTSLAHTIIDHVAVHLGKTVQLFSYELAALMVTNRMIANRGSINTNHILNATMTAEEMRSFQTARDRLATAPIFIEDDPRLTMPQIEARARKLKVSHDTALIVVDYIQKVKVESEGERRQRDIARISDGIQTLAMELNIPIIVLAQWNKKDGSIREAADIVFDAKTLLKIVRNEEKEIEDEGESAFRDIVIAKNNNGPVGRVGAIFHKAFVRFTAK